MSELQHYIDLARANTEKYPLTGCLSELRDMANQALAEVEIPHRRIENWKYTPLKTELAQNFNIQKNDVNDEVNLDPNFQNIVLRAGEIDLKLSELKGVNYTALKDISDDVLNDFLKPLDTQFKTDFTTIFNTAFLAKGQYLKFDSSLDKPIRIIHTGNTKNEIIGHLNFIQVGPGVEIDLLEEYAHNEAGYINPLSLIRCEKNSRLEHVIVQNESSESLFLNAVHSRLERDAVYNNISLHTGARKSRSILSSQLAGENAFTHIHGLYLLNEKQHHDTLSKIHHQSPHSYSDQLYKGILGDESKGIFTGKVFVDQEAQLIEAKQLNKNLILSPKAHGFSRPQLEIYADDVKCAHGSTTGQISEEELFYFEARGISKDKARLMLAGAFANDVVLKINNIKLRNTVQSFIEQRDIFKNAKS